MKIILALIQFILGLFNKPAVAPTPPAPVEPDEDFMFPEIIDADDSEPVVLEEVEEEYVEDPEFPGEDPDPEDMEGVEITEEESEEK